MYLKTCRRTNNESQVIQDNICSPHIDSFIIVCSDFRVLIVILEIHESCNLHFGLVPSYPKDRKKTIDCRPYWTITTWVVACFPGVFMASTTCSKLNQWLPISTRMNIRKFESCKFHLSSSILKRSVFLAWIVHRPFASLPCPPWLLTTFTNCFPKTCTQIGLCFLNLRRWLIWCSHMFNHLTMFDLVITTSCIDSSHPLTQWDFSSGIRSLWESIGCFSIQYHQFLSSRDACLDLGNVRIWINEQGEPTASYRWATWVWEITSSNSRLQEHHRSI